MTPKYTLKKTLFAIPATLIVLLSAGYAYAHAGPANEAAVTACEEKERSQSCEYTGGHNDLYIGFCRYRFMTGDELICVRTEPIRKVDPDKDESADDHEHGEAKPAEPVS